MDKQNQRTARLDFRLTPRQRALLELLSQGAKNKTSFLVGLIEQEAKARGIIETKSNQQPN